MILYLSNCCSFLKFSSYLQRNAVWVTCILFWGIILIRIINEGSCWQKPSVTKRAENNSRAEYLTVCCIVCTFMHITSFLSFMRWLKFQTENTGKVIIGKARTLVPLACKWMNGHEAQVCDGKTRLWKCCLVLGGGFFSTRLTYCILEPAFIKLWRSFGDALWSSRQFICKIGNSQKTRLGTKDDFRVALVPDRYNHFIQGL